MVWVSEDRACTWLPLWHRMGTKSTLWPKRTSMCDFKADQSSLPKLESLLYTFANSYISSVRTGFLNTKFYLPMIKLKSQKGEVTLRASKYVQMRISRGGKSLEHYCIRKHTRITATVKWSFLNIKGQQEENEL